ncbi:hypothetical protein V6N12_042441 [Hibiscus sabdariffa]|uniref:Putative plant transposon protein domain-containing protein n=1 Tax=Hibiscus sabdariffa TaxID=183260 RepID=A0ABR2EES8_9ROSI
MPTSHNQIVDRTRLILINTIIIGFKFNVGEVIARELSEACRNNKGILAFPCIIFALCRRATVPARQVHTPPDRMDPQGLPAEDGPHGCRSTSDGNAYATYFRTSTGQPSSRSTSSREPNLKNLRPAHTPEAHASFTSTPATLATPPSPLAEATPPLPQLQMPHLYIFCSYRTSFSGLKPDS